MFYRLFIPVCLVLWSVLAGLALGLWHVADADGARGRILLGLVLAGLAISVGVAVICAHGARRLGSGLNKLAEVTERVSRDPSGQHVLLDGSDELAQLGQAFNRLSDRLAVRVSQLEEDRDQLRTILGGMVEGVVALDADQRILFANERAHHLLELPSPSPIGRHLWEIVRQRPLLDLVQRALDQPEASRTEFTWNGTVTRSLTVHAARLPGRPPRGAVLVLHDTTELRRLERLRQDFVANVSHELKTPLSVIKANVETLMEGAIDDSEHRISFLHQIEHQADRLHFLILDLLSLARIESGQELFEFGAVPVEEVVQACALRHQTRAEARGQTLEVEGQPPTEGEPLTIWADEEALDQILDNLLDNAVKYTPQGGRIRIGWQAEPEWVQLEVSDTGIGIPPTDLPRIFERFYRVDKARSRELGGTGLGLSIVKHLTQAMGGTVHATSQMGAGTTFTLRLPRQGTAVGTAQTTPVLH
jgi:two-component system phosphate regulon sensor histidine kinase PhoR